MSTNPLLKPAFRIPFDQIKAEHVEPAVKALIETAEARLETIAAPQQRTYDTTLGALDHLSDELDFALGVVKHLESVATTPEIRAAFNAVEPLASAFYSRVPLHAGVWNALKEFSLTPAAAALTGVKKRFLEKTLRSFRKHGADLPPDKKTELEALDVELAKTTTKFAENVLDSTNAWEWLTEDEALLAGLPDSAKTQAADNAASKQKQGWRFTLQQPSYVAVLTYLDNAGIREIFYRAYQARASSGGTDNRALILKILELRKKKAVMLGYADFADYALDERMAKSGASAWHFLQDLEARTKPFFAKENAELEAFRRELEGAQAPALQPWDIAYYAEKLRQARYDFDEEQLRPYFPLEKVLEGMFAIVGRLYGISVKEEPGVPGWDPAVKFYRIVDSTGEFLSGFYADWFPRENKRGGAWMDAFLTGQKHNGVWEPHLGLMCGNLTPPVAARDGKPGKPALLTHRDVETVFHEFGHLLHHALTRVEVKSLAGTNVAWDFVELPSQIMENWCWEREALDLFARHYETGAPIPEDLFQKLKAARTFRTANGQMRQLSFGVMDLQLHRDYSPERDGDVIDYSRAVMQRFSAAALPPDHAMLNSFLHLFSSPVGYAAGYYSYKWAEVLDADAFSLFRLRGIFSAEAGAKFRNEILSRGDSEEPADLYRHLMGRDPDSSALFQRAGLV